MFIEINDKCTTKKGANAELYNNLVDSVLSSFDNNYDKDIEKIKDELNVKYEKYKQEFKKRIAINKNELYKYNKTYYTLGLDVDIKTPIISPYENLKNKILTINDFVKRQNYILKFCKFFTRSALISEDIHWRYCIKTNIKLLPTFILQLAHCFINKKNYSQELDTICAERGTISDDGNNWVDKYSGYIIKNIEFNTEEGFDDKGYKLQTREILEQQSSTQNEVQKGYQNKISDEIFKIINAITKFISIKLDNYHEFIIKNVIEINKKNLPSRENYEKLMKKSTTKSLPSYEDAFNTSLIMLTLVFILISIQISIPSINTKKTFPGCIKSFVGYPIDGNTDKTSLIYLACVTNKIKSNISPWKSIIKMNEKSIAKKMEAIIEKFITNNKEINKMFADKHEYLRLNKEEFIPSSLDIVNWINFLPPLFTFKLDSKDILPIQKLDDFIVDNIKKHKGDEVFRLLKSKIKFYTLDIINSIQTIVKDSSPILNNNSDIPFLENSCCNDDETNTIDYFMNLDTSISKNNSLIEEYNKKLENLKNLMTASILFYPLSTKTNKTQLNYVYSESTIYKGFIHYCKFATDLPTNEVFKPICGDKPENINYNADIKEIIEGFKREGKNYDINDFNVLINIINKQNTVPLNHEDSIVNNIEILRNLIKIQEYSDILGETFIENLSEIIDTYDINTTTENPAIRTLKNFLSRKIKEYKLKLTIFLNTNSKLSKRELNNADIYLNVLIDREEALVRDVDINYYIAFIKNAIHNLINVIPNIILNNLDTKNIANVKHWDLSQIHNLDIHNIIETYYESLNKFYDEKDLAIVIKNIITRLTPLNVFIKLINYISNISILDETNSSIFDKTTTIMILTYIIFTIFNIYCDIIDSELIRNELYTSYIDITGDAEYIDDDIIELVKNKISSLLYCYIEQMSSNYKLINYNNKTIIDKILKSKEVEKTQITEYLKNLSDESREIENIFKSNKLEQWGVGLQKGMTQYVKNTYDQEREKLEKQAIAERKMGSKKVATDIDRDIYKFDMEQQERVDAEIEAEENDMANIPDDDDYNSDEVGGDDDYFNY